MKYHMSPKEYFGKVIELYHNSRKPKFYNPRIRRGRSSSISSDLEDLTAFFLALNIHRNCTFYTDQPMRFEGSKPKYPDIVIQESGGKIAHLVDVKTDLGWNRDGILDFCKKWDSTIGEVKGTKTRFKQGDTKDEMEGYFSKKLKYHIVVISKENSGKRVNEHIAKVEAEGFENIFLYFLSERMHPNAYGMTISDKLHEMMIHEHEFDRLLKNTAQN